MRSISSEANLGEEGHILLAERAREGCQRCPETSLYEEGLVVNFEAAGMLGVGLWVAFPSLYRLLEEGPGEIGDSLR